MRALFLSLTRENCARDRRDEEREEEGEHKKGDSEREVKERARRALTEL